MKLCKFIGAALLCCMLSTAAMADAILFRVVSGNGDPTATPPVVGSNVGGNDSRTINNDLFPGVTVTVNNGVNYTGFSAPGDSASDGPFRKGPTGTSSASGVQGNESGTVYNLLGIANTSTNTLGNNVRFADVFFSTSASVNITDLQWRYQVGNLVGGATGNTVQVQFSPVANGGTFVNLGASQGFTNGTAATFSANAATLAGVPSTIGVTQGTFRFLVSTSSNQATLTFLNDASLGNASLQVTAVPEPGSIALLSIIGAGAMGVTVYRRRKAAK